LVQDVGTRDRSAIDVSDRAAFGLYENIIELEKQTEALRAESGSEVVQAITITTGAQQRKEAAT